MAINTLIWGFEEGVGQEIVGAISNDSQFKVCEWISDKPHATIDIWDFLLMRESMLTDYIYDEKVYLACYEKGLNTFINMYSRCSPYYTRTYHDFIDAFNIYFRKMYELVITKNIELVVFSNIMHEGADYILYLIAKELKLKTILFYQTLFNSFFVVNDKDDFGEFKNCKTLAELKEQKIVKSHKSDLFYMKGIDALNNPELKISWKYFTERFFKKDFLGAGTYLTRHARYQLFLRKSFSLSKDFDEKSKFVYFPLHMQPELTTSAIGGIYNDQILAIEKTAKLIPKDWVVLVKENPKQTDFQRGEWFFKRLTNLKNVVLVNPKTNSSLLTEKSEFVSTVTGTAGWEAIKGGKKTLVFGQAWYLSLPGVIKYKEKLTLEEINSYSFNHEQLEKEFSNLLSKAGEGYIDKNYVNGATDFNPIKNAQNILNAIKLTLQIN